MKEKTKGFTLVELLAVIVILALIALIATPIILNVINDAKENAAIQSFYGYMDAVEKTITLDELNEKEGFPSADENGCYKLTDLDTFVKVKGTKPKFDDDAKVCLTKGAITSITEITIDGYKMEFKDGKLTINGKEVEKTEEKEEKITGIPSKEYTQGEKVSYLGYNWLVMKDNGTSTQLVMDGYLNNTELTQNLPSDVDSSIVNVNGMRMCVYDSTMTSPYCNYYHDFEEYTWNKSMVKPTIENWLESKMKEKGLTKEKELIGMSFSDTKETINSYVRIPTKEELPTINNTCSDGKTNVYCADQNSFSFANYSYWTLTDSSDSCVYAYQYYVNSNSYNGIGGEITSRYSASNTQVRPVITVNEK